MFLSNHKLQHLLLKGKEIEMCRLLAIPRDILPILLKKFTEIISSPDPGGINETKEDWNPSRRASPTHLTKLLNYMAILCLFVEENWQVDVFYLKDDLGLQTREYDQPPPPSPLLSYMANTSIQKGLFKFSRMLGAEAKNSPIFKRRHWASPAHRPSCIRSLR